MPLPRTGVWRALATVATVVAALAALAAVTAAPAAAAGPYQVANYNSGLCADVAGASTADGANVRQLTCLHQSNQMWTTVGDWYSDGYLLLVVSHSGKCLDASRSVFDFGNVRQWTCHSGFNQQWSLTGGPLGGSPVPGSGRYRFVNRYSGKCLEVAGGSLSQGANIRVGTCNGGHHQLWVVLY